MTTAAAPSLATFPARSATLRLTAPRDLPLEALESLGAAADRLVWRASNAAYPVAKRAIDVAVAATALLVLAPLFAVIALAIKAEDGGPVFYVRPRVGQGGRHFSFWKFRSMCTDADARRAALAGRSDDGDAVRFKMKKDPRVTRTGRILRRLSLDELPQLWSVLTGEMSLVGPRPPIPEEVAKYDARAWSRLDVVPGITCIWQVSGRADVPFPRQVEMDLEYASRRSVLFDLELLARTVPAVLTGKGAC